MAQAKYISVAELAEAYDIRLLEQMASDTGSAVTADESEARLLNAIERGSADVQAAVLRGGRYTATDLTDLQTADDWTLKGLVAARAIIHVFRRRGGSAPADVQAIADESAQKLDDLRDGRAIFTDADAIAAGKPKVVVISQGDRDNLNLVADGPNFPKRRLTQAI